ncbi:MAG: arginine deiminase, partial [Treponema sp.]|nr:arginine deiminase [Treponema sp.]
RDPFVIVGNGIILNKMQSLTRSRETIYADYIFRYHPVYSKNIEFLYTRNEPFHIEGGDIINLTENTIAVGISQRTEAAAVEHLARKIFFESKSSVKTIYAFDIPVSRACMHLDTVFTQASENKFVVHPGMLRHLNIFKLTKENDNLKVCHIDKSLGEVLSEIFNTSVELIECGGGNIIHAEREQWNDGSNTLCVKPGFVIVYDRNYITNELLKKNGLTVIEMPSAELSRGRGGPHCMSMPFVREPEDSTKI